MLVAHWNDAGYTAPNLERYRWQWLWDSCFHAIVWAELGDERASVELASIFDAQDPSSGFVPHMTSRDDPGFHAEFWGCRGASSITQPPMYGHAAVELVARGVEVPEAVLDRARAGLGFLLDRRARSARGLVELAHPWESGCDDSPRWDDLAGGPFELPRWYERKGELVASIERGPDGEPLANPAAPVGSVSFSALVAFNAAELASITGDENLNAAADELAGAVAERWDPGLGTWVDDGPTATGSGRARTLDGLLGALVDPSPERLAIVAASLVDPLAHGATFGPTGVHRGEPTYSPETYWRGPAWPQLGYLLWVATARRGATEVASQLASALRRGAASSGFAEYWHPDRGAGMGAIPQSWTGLSIVVESPRRRR